MSVNVKKELGLKRNHMPDVHALVYGKIPPQAIEMEKSVLATIIAYPEALDIVLRIIKIGDCFYVDAHQKIYAAILDLVAKGNKVNSLLVAEALVKSGELELVGGRYFLSQLSDQMTSVTHVKAHALIVMEKFMLREIITICGTAVNDAYEDTEDVFDLLGKIEGKLGGILDNVRSGSIKSLANILMRTLMDMEEAASRPGGMLGVTTGLQKLDSILLGFAPPDLTILAAGTREGKTTLALNAAKAIAASGNPAGFFSLEMRDKQLALKVLSGEMQEDVKTLRTGKIGKDKWEFLTGTVCRKLSSLPVFVYDVGGLNIVELKAIARTMKKQHDVKIIFIDYIQLVRGVPGKRYGTREEEVNDVSKNLKALAMELDIPLVVLSQLNRIEKQNAKRMYRLSDLRESGAIEQDADNVLFIYRPILHEVPELDIQGEIWRFGETDAVIDIAKCRLGEEGTIRVKFIGKYNQFADYVQPEPSTSFNSNNQPYSPGITGARGTGMSDHPIF